VSSSCTVVGAVEIIIDDDDNDETPLHFRTLNFISIQRFPDKKTISQNYHTENKLFSQSVNSMERCYLRRLGMRGTRRQVQFVLRRQGQTHDSVHTTQDIAAGRSVCLSTEGLRGSLRTGHHHTRQPVTADRKFPSTLQISADAAATEEGGARQVVASQLQADI